MSSPTTSEPWVAEGDSVVLTVRLTPKGGRDAVGGIVRDAEGRPALAARVSAPPAGGAANKALVRLLAKALGAPKSAISFVSGETARVKRLRIAAPPADLAPRLAKLVDKS